MHLRQPFPRDSAAFVALLLLFSAFTLPHITRAMRYDEAYTARHFAVDPARALFAYTDPNNHFLHSFSVWVGHSLAGNSPIITRFPAFVFAALSLAALYRIGGRVAGGRVGITAASLLAGTLAFADYAVNARGYTLSIFLSLVVFDMIFIGKPRPTRARRYLVIALSAALVMTLPSMVVLIAAGFLWCVWNWRGGRRSYGVFLMPLVIGTIAGAMFYVPSLIAGELGEQLARFGSTPQQTLTEWLGLVTPPALGIVALALIIAGLLLAPRRLQLAVLFVIGTALILLAIQFAITGRTFFGRNYFYLLPILFLFGGIAAASILKRYSAVCALMVILLWGFANSSALARETDVDRTLAFIHTHLTAGDTIVMGCCIEEPVIYHLMVEGQPHLVIPNDETRTLYVLETEFDSPSDLLALYDMVDRVTACARLDDHTEWDGAFQLWRCSIREPGS